MDYPGISEAYFFHIYCAVRLHAHSDQIFNIKVIHMSNLEGLVLSKRQGAKS